MTIHIWYNYVANIGTQPRWWDHHYLNPQDVLGKVQSIIHVIEFDMAMSVTVFAWPLR
jgi:hypothetical protein